MAKTQASANAANAGKNQAAANSAKSGDALVKLGEDQWGSGKAPDAVKSVQAGIDKGVTDKDNAETRLGVAYLGAGQKDAAVHAFGTVKGTPNAQMIAHLWTLYAKK